MRGAVELPFHLGQAPSRAISPNITISGVFSNSIRFAEFQLSCYVIVIGSLVLPKQPITITKIL